MSVPPEHLMRNQQVNNPVNNPINNPVNRFQIYQPNLSFSGSPYYGSNTGSPIFPNFGFSQSNPVYRQPVPQSPNVRPASSIPYPMAPFASAQPGMMDFNQMAFNLADVRKTKPRKINFKGPDNRILRNLQKSEEVPERGRWEQFKDPLNLGFVDEDQSLASEIFDPHNWLGLG